MRFIDSDGLGKTYQKPVRASELMREYPKHLVCHSDSFYIGQKVCTISDLEDYKLLVGFKSRQWKLKLKTIRESDRIDSERLIGAVKKKTSFNRMGISVTYRWLFAFFSPKYRDLFASCQHSIPSVS
ncbi:hypothetical protein QJS04_geneDACA024744 [Acorus gramineus]|uniref:Uncharacterized protein n=1 Tax=Acorus gramineus TaxID=55184 RepID=A0AAV8ZZL2_ACOGR|nr:hypothetical protein QJS04_geneDACA024744 [Acorus gramineus]